MKKEGEGSGNRGRRELTLGPGSNTLAKTLPSFSRPVSFFVYK